MVKTWGVLIVLPPHSSRKIAYKLLEKHKNWVLKKHEELIRAYEYSRKVKLKRRSRKELEKLVGKYVEEAALKILGENPCRVNIRKMRTRWASCSIRKTITVNELVKYLPDYLISYLVYHEVCHLVELRHNREFWSCVEKQFKNYRELEKELLVYEVKLGLHD
jgi:Predicted metal-dependent hydrolase